jgi:hypothetical protein
MKWISIPQQCPSLSHERMHVRVCVCVRVLVCTCCLLIGRYTAAFEFSWALGSHIKTKKNVAAWWCFLCYWQSEGWLCVLKWCRWPLPILIPASQPVQHHKRVLWKGNNSMPTPDCFHLSSIVGTWLATHLPFHYSLTSCFPFPGSACVFQSIHTLDELIHSLAFFSLNS